MQMKKASSLFWLPSPKIQRAQCKMLTTDELIKSMKKSPTKIFLSKLNGESEIRNHWKIQRLLTFVLLKVPATYLELEVSQSAPHIVLKSCSTKAELPLEGIFFALNYLPWEFVLVKKLEIEKTKTTFIISVLKVV